MIDVIRNGGMKKVKVVIVREVVLHDLDWACCSPECPYLQGAGSQYRCSLFGRGELRAESGRISRHDRCKEGEGVPEA